MPNRKAATLAELADLSGGRLAKEEDGALLITSAAPLQEAGEGDIAFLANSKYEKHLPETNASAIILDEKTEFERLPVIRHPNPYAAFARVLSLLYPDQPLVPNGVDESALIDKSASIDSSTAVGPFCIVGKESMIGKSGQLVASVYVGNNVTIGENCLFYPGIKIMSNSMIGDNVTIHSGAIIGSDGFGFAPSESGFEKVKQIGWVEIGDNVEIGANTTIDRGALGATKIGSGTKIDNLVQIAHNVEIGHNCIIVSQVGISGSTKLGNGVILGGQVGLAGHIELGDGVQVGAQSGVSKSTEAGKKLFGCPAREIMKTKRIEAALTRLPDLLKRVKKLEDERSD